MQKHLFGAVLAVMLALGAPLSAQDDLADARAALDEYFRAFNAEDNDALAAISNFPRVSIGRNGQVVVREEPAAIETDFLLLRQVEGWDHSTLDLVEAVQASPDAVHFKVVFSRRKVDGAAYRTVPGLFVMTKQDGEWGLTLQSILPATFQEQ